MYEVKIGFKKYKNVKGHVWCKENNNVLMLILEDERRVFVITNNCTVIEFSDGWFKQEAESVKKESQGKAVINSKVKV